MLTAKLFEAMGCYFHFCACPEARAGISEEETQRGLIKREYHGGKEIKDTKLLRYGNVTGGTTSKMMNLCKNSRGKQFPIKLLLLQESVLAKIKEDNLFDYFQCDFELPDGSKCSRIFYQSLLLDEQILVII